MPGLTSPFDEGGASSRGGTLAGVGRYGPNTAEVGAPLTRAGALTQTQLYPLQHAYWLTRGEGEQEHLLMPRDYAWRRFHTGLAEHGLREAFDAFWERLLPQWGGQSVAWWTVRDAAGATMLVGHAGHGPFRVGDLDVLLAPWRSVVDDCARSRLALTIVHRHPYEVDEGWWAVIDAVLAPRGN